MDRSLVTGNPLTVKLFFQEKDNLLTSPRSIDKLRRMESIKTKSTDGLAVAALITVQVIFGFNYWAAKVVLAHYPPVFWGGIRAIVSAILMFLVAFAVVPKEQRKIDRKFLFQAFLYGAIGIGLNNAFFMLGLRYTTTTNAAILNALTPLFTLLFAVIAGAEKVTPQKGLGFALAVFGAIVIRRFEDFSMTSDTFRGDIYTILNCATLALFFILSRDFLKKHAPFWAMAWMFLFGAVVLFVGSIGDFGNLQALPMNGSFVFAMVYNVVLATAVTYFLNSWALTRVKPSFVAVFIYLQPAIALINVWMSGEEAPNARVLLAMALIFAGVGIGALKKA